MHIIWIHVHLSEIWIHVHLSVIWIHVHLRLDLSE
jgi:hypothetical protein